MADINKLCLGCMRELPEGAEECPHCKFNSSMRNSAEFLPLKTMLEDRFAVGKIVSFNGEGATYLGYDTELDTPVRIREFFPSGMCERRDNSVHVLEDSIENFVKEKNEFLKLARGLARMRNLSAILPVYDIFEANGTAYYVSETVESITLRDFLIRNGGSLNYEQVRSLFMPIMQTLSSLHAVGIIHRGISPDTLMIGKDGKMRLTEFCVPSARTARSDMAAHLFKGYAAIEQYGFDGEQGPWTDVYSLAATMYRALVGSPPPEATARVTNDKMIVPAAVADTLSAYVMSGLANALQILPNERTQSIEIFRDEISASPNVVTRAADRNSRSDDGKKQNKSGGKTKYVIISMLVTLIALGAIAVVIYYGLFKPNNNDDTETTAAQTQTEFYSENIIDPEAVEVPALVGRSFADVVEDTALKRYKIELAEVKMDDESAGKIISQEPKEGETIKRSDTIKVVVSLGNSLSFKIPNIVGKSKFDAYDALVKAGVNPNLIKWETKYSSKYDPDAIVGVSPDVGEDANGQMYVTVYVNSYTTTAPTEAPTTRAPATIAPRMRNTAAVEENTDTVDEQTDTE